MKEYLVSIKRIQKINLIFSEKTSKKALNKVVRFIDDCKKNDLDFERLFDDEVKFEYHVKKVSKIGN